MKNKKIKFSIVMPAYNAEKFIKESILSVLSQSYKYFELIIVDDGSTDSTKKIVKSFKDKRIKYIYQKNKGVSAARNNAIKYSKGSWIAFLDSDDKWMKDTLNTYYKFANDYDVVIGEYKYMNKKENVPAYNLSGLPKNRKGIMNKLLNGNFIGTGAIAFKKDIIDEYFDEKLKFGEDYKLWLHILTQTKKIKIIDKILYEYRVHGDSALQNTDFKELELAKIIKQFSKHDKSAKKISDVHYNNYLSDKINKLIAEEKYNNDFEESKNYKITKKNRLKLMMYSHMPSTLKKIRKFK